MGYSYSGYVRLATRDKNIKDVYTEFVNWVTSGGKENKDWYKKHNGQVFKKW